MTHKPLTNAEVEAAQAILTGKPPDTHAQARDFGDWLGPFVFRLLADHWTMLEIIDELSGGQEIRRWPRLGCDICVIQIDEDGNAAHEEDCIKGKARALIAAVKGGE